MARRKKKRQKIPIVDSHWTIWGLGLTVGIPAMIMMPMAYGADVFGIGFGIGTCAACVAGGYVLRVIAHRML